MEADELLRGADPSHRGGLEDQPGGTVGVIGSGDDAGGGFHLPQLVAEFCLTKHQAVYIHRQCPLDHIRLVAAQNNGILALKQQIFPVLGQSNGNLAPYGVDVFTGIVQHLALQNGEHVKQRHILQSAGGNLLHIVAGNVLTA